MVTILDPSPPNRLRGMIYNVRVSRPGVDAAGAVIRAMRNHNVDIAWLQETAKMVETKAAREILADAGLQLVAAPHGDRMARSTAIVARRGVALRGPSLHPMHAHGWERGGGRDGLHDPREWVSARAGFILRSTSVHFPPTPWAPHKPKRGQAWMDCLGTLDGMLSAWEQHGSTWLLPGDWNVKPKFPRYWREVEALADHHDGTIHRAGGVDFVISGPGLRITGMRRLWRKYGSDHRPRVFTIHDDR